MDKIETIGYYHSDLPKPKHTTSIDPITGQMVVTFSYPDNTLFKDSKPSLLKFEEQMKRLKSNRENGFIK